MKSYKKSIPILRNKSKEERRQMKLALLFIGPSFIGVCLFVLAPFVDVLKRSFSDGLGNYQTVISNEAFHQAVGNTARFLLVCIPLLLLLSLVISVWLMRIRHMRNLMKTILLVPFAIPVASAALLWKMLFDQQGAFNNMLQMCGIQTVDWMNSGAAFAMLVLCYLWKNIGYFVVLWLAGLAAISPDWYEAAAMDGANRRQQFRYITFPNLRSTIRMNLVLAVVNSFKVFREAYLVAGNYPEPHIYLLQHLFNNWFTQLDLGKMSAAAVLLVLVATALVLWVNHRERRGEE